MQEIFKDIKDYPNYRIGSKGTVISYQQHKERIMKPFLGGSGKYYMITLCNNGVKKKKLIHRLVCEAFVDNPENKPVVNHKDHNTHNNDYQNLEWVTTQENIHHSYSTMSPIRNTRKCKLTFEDGTYFVFYSCADMIKFHINHQLKGSYKSLIRHGHSKGLTLELL